MANASNYFRKGCRYRRSVHTSSSKSVSRHADRFRHLHLRVRNFTQTQLSSDIACSLMSSSPRSSCALLLLLPSGLSTSTGQRPSPASCRSPAERSFSEQTDNSHPSLHHPGGTAEGSNSRLVTAEHHGRLRSHSLYGK